MTIRGFESIGYLLHMLASHSTPFSVSAIDDPVDRAEFILQLSMSDDDLVAYQNTAGNLTYLVNSPELAEDVFSNNLFEPPPHPYRDLVGYYSEAGKFLLRIPGAVGKRAGIPDHVFETWSQVFAQFYKELDQFANSGMPIDFGETSKKWVLRGTTQILFGRDLGCEAETFVRASNLVEESFVNRGGIPRHGESPTVKQTLDEAERHLEYLAYELLGSWVPSGSQEIARTVVRTVLNAYNAMATSLAWTMFLLACHPIDQRILRGHVKSIVASEDRIWVKNVSASKLIRNVVQESLRLFPPAWLLGRTARKPATVGDYCFESGADLVISPYAMHRKHALWEFPAKFMPQRFESSNDFGLSFFPFGAGMRRCPASHFIVPQLQGMLGLLLRRFSFSATSEAVRPRGLVSLRPAPYLRLFVRSGE